MFTDPRQTISTTSIRTKKTPSLIRSVWGWSSSSATHIQQFAGDEDQRYQAYEPDRRGSDRLVAHLHRFGQTHIRRIHINCYGSREKEQSFQPSWQWNSTQYEKVNLNHFDPCAKLLIFFACFFLYEIFLYLVVARLFLSCMQRKKKWT